mmetsp:Transcript_64314/g.119541  ORF Transcript_64314/g.119541 Transcript_64314/m.119541 type:complete len:281 (+) Transcript_64314:56-898(+)
MLKIRTNLLLAVLLLSTGVSAVQQTVVVTGATGGTGQLVYKLFKSTTWTVRGLVRNATKAKDVLDCGECTEKEGIFVGDITKPETLAPVMRGATVLVIATSSMPKCSGGVETCHYAKGQYPVDVDYHGGIRQLTAFANATKGIGHAILISSRGTTEPDSFLDKMGNGYALFYKLNLEAWLYSSGLSSTIIKPCGLDDSEPRAKKLLLGHDDEPLGKSNQMSRGDVARLIIAAALNRNVTSGQRIDVCSDAGAAQSDKELAPLLVSNLWPWQQQQSASVWI